MPHFFFAIKVWQVRSILLYLALQGLQIEFPKLDFNRARDCSKEKSHKGLFVQGFFMNVLNPKGHNILFSIFSWFSV
jgi:threonine/homoserine/homoserine lactone efflux protein